MTRVIIATLAAGAVALAVGLVLVAELHLRPFDAGVLTTTLALAGGIIGGAVAERLP